MEELRQEIKDIPVTNKNLQFFIILLGAMVFAVVYRTPALSNNWPLVVGIGIILIATLFIPRVISPIYKLWMTLALIIGFFVSTIILTIVFICVITPMAVTMKILKRKTPFALSKKSQKSYWIRRKHNTDIKQYLEQY